MPSSVRTLRQRVRLLAQRLPRHQSGRYGALLLALLLLGVGMAVYGYALTLPYHIDDFVHFRWVSTHSLAQVWTSAAGLSYYRPLPFTVWEAIRALAGGFPPVAVHAVNVVLHAVNGALLFVLMLLHDRGARVWVRVPGALVAALFFLLFPFSYQAVPWAGALTHPLVLFLILGSLVAGVVGRESHNRFLVLLSMTLALLAPFAHETGVLAAPLLTFFYLTAGHGLSLRRALSRAWPFWACSVMAAAVLLWLRSHSGLSAQPVDLISRWQNAVYFLQGLAYPVAPLAQQLRVRFPGLNDLLAILAVCLPGLAFLTWLAVRFGQGRRAFFALGWYVAAIAPAWLLLGFSYVVDGPRLMYEASPGAAVLWALPVSLAVQGLAMAPERLAGLLSSARGRWRAVGLVASALFTVGTLVGSASFLAERADMYAETRLATEGLLSATSGLTDTRQTILSINFPGWIAPQAPTYALGHEGVTFVPNYSSPMDLVWAITGREVTLPNLVVEELQSNWRFNYQNYGRVWTLPQVQPVLRDAGKVLFTSYRANHLVTYDVGNLEYVNQPRPAGYVAAYSGTLALVSGSWQRVGGTLQVTLHWQSWLTLTQEVRTFVHMQNEAGELVAQEDGLPMMGVANPLWWHPGDQWRDMRVLVLPPNLQPGRYTLRAGVYPAFGGSRYPALDPAGNRAPDDSATLGVYLAP